MATTALADVSNLEATPPTKKTKIDPLEEEGERRGRGALRVKKLTEHATLPTRGSAQAAGYDLYSAYDVTLPAEGKAIVKTDIALAVPEGCYGRVAPRSSLSWKHHIDVGAGVIDRDYRGNVGVVLFNLSKQDYKVKRGERVAQLVLERVFTPAVLEVDCLGETERGAGGFGSTGN